MSYYQQPRPFGRPAYAQKPQLEPVTWLNGAGPGLIVVLRPYSGPLDGIGPQLAQNAVALPVLPWQRGQQLPDDVVSAQALTNGRSRAFIVGKSFDRHLTIISGDVVGASCRRPQTSNLRCCGFKTVAKLQHIL